VPDASTSAIPSGTSRGIAGNSPAATASDVRRIRETNRTRTRARATGFSEYAALKQWSVENGVELPSSYIDDLVAANAIEYRDEGAEHVVYHYADGGRAIKVTRPGLLVLEYLDRWAFSNRIFGDDVEIVGTLGEGSRIQIVISQKWIIEDEDGADITQFEIDRYFEDRLFARFTIQHDAIAYYNADLALLATPTKGTF
jgi:hypothetical protein